MAEEVETAATEPEVATKQAKEKPAKVKTMPKPDREAFDAELGAHQALIASNYNRMVRARARRSPHM